MYVFIRLCHAERQNKTQHRHIMKKGVNKKNFNVGKQQLLPLHMTALRMRKNME